ncbi:MAG: OmpH family outer membrane protein [Bacteroidales bacterium]
MKRFLGIAAIALMAIFTGQNVLAQGFKFAHINKTTLIQAMPEYDSANVKLQKTQKELSNTLDIMQVELNNKYEAYNKDAKNLTDVVKQVKEQELQDMQKRIQESNTNFQIKLQDLNTSLIQPIVAKADKAIQEAGKEGGYIYVFDTSGGQVLYFDETKSTNILALVKTKLGLK